MLLLLLSTMAKETALAVFPPALFLGCSMDRCLGYLANFFTGAYLLEIRSYTSRGLLDKTDLVLGGLIIISQGTRKPDHSSAVITFQMPVFSGNTHF